MEPKVETVEIKYYSTLDIPYHRFRDCMCANNLSELIISGFPEEAVLKEAWHNILDQYTAKIGNNEYKLYLSMYKEVSQLAITIDQIILLAARPDEAKGVKTGILRIAYDEYLCGELNKLLNTACKFNPADHKSYIAELDKCYNRKSGLKIRLDLMNMRFDALEKKQTATPGKKIDADYYDSILITLSDFAHYNLPETIKMSEYCLRLQKYNKAGEKPLKR